MTVHALTLTPRAAGQCSAEMETRAMRATGPMEGGDVGEGDEGAAAQCYGDL